MFTLQKIYLQAPWWYQPMHRVQISEEWSPLTSNALLGKVRITIDWHINYPSKLWLSLVNYIMQSLFTSWPNQCTSVIVTILSYYSYIPGVLLYVPLCIDKHRMGGSALAQCYQQIGEHSPDLDQPQRFVKIFNTTQHLIKGPSHHQVKTRFDIFSIFILDSLITKALKRDNWNAHNFFEMGWKNKVLLLL